MKTDNPMKEEK